MGGFQHTFQRIEKKYILNEYQYKALRNYLDKIAKVDQYGWSTILNLYFDTPDYRLIRASIEGKQYKEKLRFRSYGVPQDTSSSFVEMKKKYKGVVYKRRIDLSYQDAIEYLKNKGEIENPDQKQKEIRYFFNHYPDLKPMMALSYDRIALAGIEDPNFRVTFDTNLRWRTDDLDLRYGNVGYDILGPNLYLMELKIAGAVDPELSEVMSRLKIFPTNFSKYGRGYQMLLKKKLSENDSELEYYTSDFVTHEDTLRYPFTSIGQVPAAGLKRAMGQ